MYVPVCYRGFLSGSVIKNLPANAGATGSIPESGRSPGEGNGNSLQGSHLENSMDIGAWQVTVHGVTKEPRHDLVIKQPTTTKGIITLVVLFFIYASEKSDRLWS